MAKNSLYEDATSLKVPVTIGTKSGDATLFGTAKVPGYLLTDKGSDNEATVKFGPCGAKFSVKAENGSGNSKVSIGDSIFIDAEGKLTKIATGTLFGVALSEIASGSTATIGVKIAAF